MPNSLLPTTSKLVYIVTMGNCCGVTNAATLKAIEAVVGKDGHYEWEKMPLPVTYESLGLPNPSKEAKAEAAKSTIEAFVEVVLTAFEENGDGPFDLPSIKAILDKFHFGSSAEVMKALNFESGPYCYDTVKAFVQDIAKHTLQNEVLVEVIGLAVDMGIPLLNRQSSEVEKAWIVEAVQWAYVLEVVTRTAEDNREFLKTLHTHLSEIRNGPLSTWKDKVTDFEYLKTISVEPVVLTFLPSKRAESRSKATYKEAATSNLALTLNMMEAMWEDYKNGNVNNAEAGYEMAMLDGLFDYTRQANRARVSSGNMWIFSPIPLNWTDLYQSWDMNFIYQSFPDDFPIVLMKLFVPCVANYPENPERYLVPRVIALYCQTYRITVETVEGRPSLPPIKDCVNEQFLQLWSKVNLIYAKRYRAFYEELGKGLAGALRTTSDSAADEFTKKMWKDFKDAVDRGEPEAVTEKITNLLQLISKLKLSNINATMLQRNIKYAGERREQLDQCIKDSFATLD